jgi:predicted Zn finger-like uncharacterized protein
MSEPVVTRCPGCRTAFRVTPEQLASREGQVRCGQCRAVFDANDHLVAGTPREPEAVPAAESSDAPEKDVALPPSAVDESDAATTGALDRSRQYEWRPRKRLREQPKALYALAIVALLALLGAQALFEYHDSLAAHAPFTRPLLDAACRAAGCEIAPLRDASALWIEASDLEADPAHKGLLKLSATVRNRASYPIAYPYLELALTDASDTVVARRAFPPTLYVERDAPATGIAPNGEVLVRLYLDASATSEAGYRVYLFYP